MTLREALLAAERELARAGCDTPGLDARVLLEHVTGYGPAALLTRDRDDLGPRKAAFEALVARRVRREPVAYLVGHKEFFSLRFEVGPGVLVPRPDTETLVEASLAELPRDASGNASALVVDVGTGSGAIAVALAHEAGGSALLRIVAVDRCAGALALARANARRLLAEGGVNRAAISFLRSDLTYGLAPESVDLLLCNPPYLSPDELAVAPPELAFEPRLALDGRSRDGLGVIRKLLADACRVLRPQGRLLCEIGFEQEAGVVEIASRMGFSGVQVIRDLGGRPRVLRAVMDH